VNIIIKLPEVLDSFCSFISRFNCILQCCNYKQYAKFA